MAVNALSGIRDLPQLLAAAQAKAEEATTPAKRAPTMPAETAAAKPSSAPVAPACMQSPADIAKAAGISPGELQTITNLTARRGQLDERERTLDTQLQLLAAAEAKLDGKIKALATMKGEIKALLGQADQQQQAEVDRLVSVYQKMKPKDAAAVMATLDDKVRIPVAAKMKDAALASILALMPTAEAKKLTESLAHRYTAVQSLSQADGAATAPTGDAASQTADASPAGPDVKPADTTTKDAKTADTGDAAKAPVKIHMAVRKPPARRHATPKSKLKTDTPTLAAAKAVVGADHKPGTPQVPAQTALSAAGSAPQSAKSSTPASPLSAPVKPAAAAPSGA